MKVSTKLYLGTVLQFLVALSLVAVFLYMLQKQEHDSIVINLAGRQRMLSQKMTKEILLFSQGVFPAEKVLDTLARGGDVTKQNNDMERSIINLVLAGDGRITVYVLGQPVMVTRGEHD